MTRAQHKKLDTIVVKIEALQADIENKTQKETDALVEAKKRLMSILEM